MQRFAVQPRDSCWPNECPRLATERKLRPEERITLAFKSPAVSRFGAGARWERFPGHAIFERTLTDSSVNTVNITTQISGIYEGSVLDPRVRRFNLGAISANASVKQLRVERLATRKRNGRLHHNSAAASSRNNASFPISGTSIDYVPASPLSPKFTSIVDRRIASGGNHAMPPHAVRNDFCAIVRSACARRCLYLWG